MWIPIRSLQNSAMTYKVGPSFTTLAPDKLWRNLENFRERVNSCGGLWGMVRINQLKKNWGGPSLHGKWMTWMTWMNMAHFV